METQLTEKEKEIWKTAKKRVGFKRHLLSYIVINSMFWCIWYFSETEHEEGSFPWPVWPMLGWGIGLLFSYFDAYVYPKSNAVEKEFERLKNR